MKRHVLCSLVLTGLLTTGGVLFAQDAAPAPADQSAQAGAPAMGRQHHMDPDRQLAHMTKRYNLTADQQSQIKPILQDQQQQMETLRGDTSLSRQDKRAKMMSLHQDSTQKIEAVLNDDQKQKYEADQQKMQEHRAEHMHGGSAPAPQQ